MFSPRRGYLKAFAPAEMAFSNEAFVADSYQIPASFDAFGSHVFQQDVFLEIKAFLHSTEKLFFCLGISITYEVQHVGAKLGSAINAGRYDEVIAGVYRMGYKGSSVAA